MVLEVTPYMETKSVVAVGNIYFIATFPLMQGEKVLRELSHALF